MTSLIVIAEAEPAGSVAAAAVRTVMAAMRRALRNMGDPFWRVVVVAEGSIGAGALRRMRGDPSYWPRVVRGARVIVYTRDGAADRAFLRDVLGFDAVTPAEAG